MGRYQSINRYLNINHEVGRRKSGRTHYDASILDDFFEGWG
jgi:hypothetical protein